MILKGKTYKLIEGTAACNGCAILPICDQMADDLNLIEFCLCMCEEDSAEYENPIFILDENANTTGIR